MTIHYMLTGAGWSECDIEIDGQRAHITAFYLFDALDNLCLAVIDLFGRDKSTIRRGAGGIPVAISPHHAAPYTGSDSVVPE